jgi:uncharacterized membrane protein YkvA (DUF1232 family)
VSGITLEAGNSACAAHERLEMFKLGWLLARFRRELRLVWAMLRDVRTPVLAKLTAVLAVLYVLSPADLVPDVLPILGWLDDGLVAYWLFKLAQHFLPEPLLAALKQRVDGKGDQPDFQAK